MRVVLDSSVLIAAAISRAGVCAELLQDVLTAHELIVSEFIIAEVARKLSTKFRFPKADIADVRRLLETAGTLVSPAMLPPEVCRDPDDVPIIGTAVAGQAELLVSVDKDLLALRCYVDVRIIKPGQFWEWTTRREN